MSKACTSDVAVLALLVLTRDATALSFERVRLVDAWTPSELSSSTSAASTTSPRLLFRGDVPDWRADDSHMQPNASGVSFNYTGLVKLMAMRAAEVQRYGTEQELLAKPWFIVDVNLLSPTSPQQNNAIDAEAAFFSLHPSEGVFVNWPIVGTSVDPMDVEPASNRTTMAANFPQWDGDHLHDRIAHLYDTLTNASSGSLLPGQDPARIPEGAIVAIYVHCIGGEDRTGEVIGSYNMAVHNWTAQRAFFEDWSVAQRWPHANQRHSMQWYCLFLDVQPGSLDRGCMFMMPPSLSPLPTVPNTPCGETKTFIDCGYRGNECLWIDGRCTTNCVRWPTLELCDQNVGKCKWMENATPPRCERWPYNSRG